MSFSVGSSAYGMSVSQVRRNNQIEVEWYISEDKSIFTELLKHKSAIESETGIQFDWRELPDKKASRIIAIHNADFENKELWAEQFDWIIDTAIKMKKVFKKFL
jgi:two-component SAPR family response regulator